MKKKKKKNQIPSTNFHSLLRYILYFSYGFLKTSRKQKQKREKNNYIGCECSLEVIRIRNRIYPIAERIQLISPTHLSSVHCTYCTLSKQHSVLPQLFFSVYLSCIHFSSPLIHWCSKNRNIIKTFLGFQSN